MRKDDNYTSIKERKAEERKRRLNGKCIVCGRTFLMAKLKDHEYCGLHAPQRKLIRVKGEPGFRSVLVKEAGK